MSIGNCDCCPRRDVPGSVVDVPGEPFACFICQGDTDPDPYGEIPDTTNMHVISIDDVNMVITPEFVDAQRTFKQFCRDNPGCTIEWNKNCPLAGRMIQLGNYVPGA